VRRHPTVPQDSNSVSVKVVGKMLDEFETELQFRIRVILPTTLRSLIFMSYWQADCSLQVRVSLQVSGDVINDHCCLPVVVCVDV